MGRSKTPAMVLLIGLLLAACLGHVSSYDLLDVEEMLMEVDGLGRALLQAGGGGTYGGYGPGGYGYGYGQGQEAAALPQYQEVTTYRTECKDQTNPTTLQVFVAMLQPTRPLNDIEVAQDSPSGMMTLYVDPRSGEAWVSGDINNVQNMTAVTVNAGNTTESGPVLMPLLPSASGINVDGKPTTISNLTANSTLLESLWNATFGNASSSNNTAATTASAGGGGNTTTSQAPGITVMGFNPPLPWIAHMMFSQKVFTNGTVPLLANATVNNTMGANMGGNNNNNNSAGAMGGNNNANAAVSSGNNLAGNAIGLQPMGWVNLTEMLNTLGNGNNTVTTTTKFTVNGSVSETNITGGNNNRRGVVPQNAAGGNKFNAGDFNNTNVLALLQAGLAYASVWTGQSGDGSELRGQFMPYGKFVGASPAMSASFPDALVPRPNYTETICRKVPVVTRVRRPGTTAEAGGPGGAMRGAVTTDVFGQDVVGNNYTAQAVTTLPGVATALANITTRNDTNMKGNYSIFAAAVDAASRFLNSSPTAAVGNAANNAANTAAAAGNTAATGARNAAGTTAAGANNAAAATNQTATNAGRRLLQAAAPAAASKPSGGLNMTQKVALAGTGGTGGVTVFAPTNQAIEAYLKSANLTAQQLLANKTLLLKVISFHINPNEALGTAGIAKLRYPTKAWKTLLPYNNIGYSTDRKGAVTLYGAAGSSAKIVDANMRSGNIIVQGIDKVLVPPVLAQNSTNTSSKKGSTPRRLMELIHGLFV